MSRPYFTRQHLTGAAVQAALALTVAAQLAGCAQPSEFKRLALAVPQNWTASTPTVGSLDAAKTHWRAFFTDPRLQLLIGTALEQNRDLRIAAARVQESRAQFGLVRAEQLPLVNLLGRGAIERSPASVSGVGGQSTGQRYDLTLSSVSFEVDFWGRLARLSDAARDSYLATEESRRAVQLSLVADVATAYFNLLQFDDLVGLAHATVVSRERSRALLIKGHELGAAQEYEVQQATGAVEAARGNLAALAQQRSVATNQINFLIGQVPATLPPARPLEAQGLDAELSPGLPGEVLLARPDVMAAERRLIAAHANVDAARAAFFPKVLLTAGLGVAGLGLGSLFSGGAWAFQPLLSLPLFDGGRSDANADVAAARKNIAVAEYEKTVQLAFREASDQLSARVSLASQLRSAQANTSAQQRRLQIAQARFDAGTIGYLDVLDAQRDLVTAQQTFVQVRRAQLDAAAQLYKALGGGSQADFADNGKAVAQP